MGFISGNVNRAWWADKEKKSSGGLPTRRYAVAAPRQRAAFLDVLRSQSISVTGTIRVTVPASQPRRGDLFVECAVENEPKLRQERH
jgi:hypothetical protein